MIAIFVCVICTSVLLSIPTFRNLAKQSKVQARIVIATGVNVGLAKWIIDGTHAFLKISTSIKDFLLMSIESQEILAKWACVEVGFCP